MSFDSGLIPMANRGRQSNTTARGRSSRDSSVVSTRTRTSINTFQEDTRSLRSVDVMAGGMRYHISRDTGVTSHVDNLPPYSEPPIEALAMEDPSPTTPTERDQSANPDSIPEDRPLALFSNSVAALDLSVPELPSQYRPRRTVTIPRVRSITDIIHHQIEPGMSAMPVYSREHDIPQISRSTNSIPTMNSIIPPEESKSQKAPPNEPALRQRRPSQSKAAPSRRRTGIRLPKIFTGFVSSGQSQSAVSAPGETTPLEQQQATRSADGSLETPDFFSQHSLSPRLISPSSAAGNVSSTTRYHQRRASVPNLQHHPIHSYTRSDGASSALPVESPHIDEGLLDTHAPLPMDSENEISLHYTRLIRTIDRDHRRELLRRDKELTAMRQRLNEMDQVYRQELRGRDFTIDDLRRRLEALEEGIENKIERARHEVEDQWESRWKDRDRHLVERMRRMELDSQRNIEQAITERDAEWAAQWTRRNEQLFRRLRITEAAVRQAPVLPR